MYKKAFLYFMAIGTIFILLPIDALAQTSSDFGSQDIITHSNKVRLFLFGPVMTIVGYLGGAYGLMQAILSSSPKPLIIFGGIGLSVSFIPKFIDGVYNVSGMLIP